MCNVCGGVGWVRVEVPLGHPQFGKTVRCDCKVQEDSNRLQQLSGLTEGERRITLDGIETAGRTGTSKMVNACRTFVQQPTGILTLWGGVGNAKTMALQAVVNALVAKNVDAVYVTAFDLFSHIRAAMNEKREVMNQGVYERLVRFENVTVLAVDEFDKIRVTDWVMEQVTDLIDKRYRFGLDGSAGTVLAMNSDPAGQPEWIASRLLDGRNHVVYNPDRDIRPALKG